MPRGYPVSNSPRKKDSDSSKNKQSSSPKHKPVKQTPTSPRKKNSDSDSPIYRSNIIPHPYGLHRILPPELRTKTGGAGEYMIGPELHIAGGKTKTKAKKM